MPQTLHRLRHRVFMLVLIGGALLSACAGVPGYGDGCQGATRAAHDSTNLDLNGFMQQLTARGLTVRIIDASEPAYMTDELGVTGTAIAIGAATVVAHSFNDENAAYARTQCISSDGSTIHRGSQVVTVDYIAPASWYKRGKLIVFYVGKDDATRTSLSAVLGAPFAGATSTPAAVQALHVLIA